MATPLNADQLNTIAQSSGYKGGTFSSIGLSPINSTSLQQSSAIKVQSAPQTDYSGAVNNGYATIAANGTSLTPQAPTDTGNNDLTSLFSQYLGSEPAAPSASAIYNKDYNASGIGAAQGGVNTANKAYLGATGTLTGLQNQLAGITAEGQAMNLRQDNRQAPISAIQGQQGQNNRETAIRALALQPQVLAAQAQVAAAQGNQQLAQGILQQAQQHLDTTYQIHMQDAQAQYAYQKDQRDKVYQFATAQEKAKIDALQHTADQKFEMDKLKIQNDYNTQQKNLSGQAGLDTTPAATSQSYALQAGDDPWNIAQANGIDMAGLQKMNPQVKDWHNLPVGYKLNLPLSAGQLSTNPTVDNYAQGILDGSVTSIAQVPKQYKDAVQAALSQPGQNGYSPLASRRFTMAANAIVNNYIALPQYQLTANGLPYLQRIDAALKTPGSVSDQDLLDSLTKLNTAGNAITDAQVKIITGGKSFSDSVNTFQNKFANGGVLSTNQRQQIQKIATAIYDNYKSGYQPVYDQAVKQLKGSGIPEPFWTIPDLNKLGIVNGDTTASFDSTSARSKYGY